MARSSTESELIGLDEALLHLLWFRQIMDLLGYPQNPAYAFQDNKSTIFVCQTGHSKSAGRFKHMAIRYYFIKSLIEDGKVSLKYVPTEQMIADILTKPLVGQLFQTLRSKILNL